MGEVLLLTYSDTEFAAIPPTPAHLSPKTIFVESDCLNALRKIGQHRSLVCLQRHCLEDIRNWLGPLPCLVIELIDSRLCKVIPIGEGENIHDSIANLNWDNVEVVVLVQIMECESGQVGVTRIVTKEELT